MSLLELIIEKSGVRASSYGIGGDSEAQILIASLLALVAKSDGGISPDENVRIVNLLSKRFGLESKEALELVDHAAGEFSGDARLEDVVESLNDVLSRAQKEDLMFMVLCVIAADDQKDPREIALLDKLIGAFRLPDATMQRLYSGDFDALF